MNSKRNVEAKRNRTDGDGQASTGGAADGRTSARSASNTSAVAAAAAVCAEPW